MEEPAPPPAFFLVDAFTAARFSGNGAAVVLLPSTSDDAWPTDAALQGTAAEFRQSETAFLFQRSLASGWALRWFTPTTEVDLCGHATLAAAAAALEGGASLPLSFHTKSGELCVARHAGKLELDMPAHPPAEVTPTAAGVALCTALAEAFRLPPSSVVWCGRADSLGDLVAVLADVEAVLRASPVEAAVAALGGRGVVLTAAGGAGGVDATSRCFYPSCGILEDPVTGSAHAALHPLWAARLGLVGGGEGRCLRFRQASARGGDLLARVPAPGRVAVAGDVAVVVRGRLGAPLL